MPVNGSPVPISVPPVMVIAELLQSAVVSKENLPCASVVVVKPLQSSNFTVAFFK